MDNLGQYGPISEDVLNLQHTHRSGPISAGDEDADKKLVHRHSGGMFWGVRHDLDVEGFDGRGRPFKCRRLHWRVVQRLEAMGFYGVYRCGEHKVNLSLITALVERWRTETHTFHFTFGEATVTLQDVSYLYALPIEGRPVITTQVETDVPRLRQQCQELLGYNPPDNDFPKPGQIHMVRLAYDLMGRVITDDSPPIEVDRYARGVVLILFGNILFPNTSGNCGSLAYLPLLANIDQCNEYSWGSALLSYLYNQLCLASARKRDSIGGPMQLLQIWAWSRITFVMPNYVKDVLQMDPLELPHGGVLPGPPMAADFSGAQECNYILIHNLRNMRQAFDHQTEDQFIWDPYTTSNSATLQAYLSAQIIGPSPTWFSECPLIHFNTVELYHPSRVLRQFGIRQSIPPAVPQHHRTLHNTAGGRSLRRFEDWILKHHDQIQAWDNRHQHVVGGHALQPGEPGVAAGYMRWYTKITRRIITPEVDVSTGYQPQRRSLLEKMVKHISKLRLFTRKSRNLEPTIRANFEAVFKQADDDIRAAGVEIYGDEQEDESDDEPADDLPPASSPPNRHGTLRRLSTSSLPPMAPPRFGESSSALPPMAAPRFGEGTSQFPPPFGEGTSQFPPPFGEGTSHFPQFSEGISQPHFGYASSQRHFTEGGSISFGLATPALEDQPRQGSFTQLLQSNPWPNPYYMPVQPPHFSNSPVPFNIGSSSHQPDPRRHSFHTDLGLRQYNPEENDAAQQPRRNAHRRARDTHPSCGT